MVARFLGLYRFLNEGNEIVVRTAAGQHAVEIMIEVGKEAGADLAIRSEADAAARTAKGLRDRRDYADFPQTIVETITAGGFTRVVRGQGHQRAIGVDLFDDFLQRNDYIGGPQAIFFEGHELDKTNDHAFFSREPGEGDDLIVV